MFTSPLLPTYHALYIEGYGNCIQNGSHNYRGQNPLDGSESPRATRARDEATQGVATSWHIQSPIEGTWHPQASYLSLDWEVSFVPLWGWHQAVRVFYTDYPGKKCETTCLDLIGGGGRISPYLILWRYTCPSWLSPPNSDPGTT
jgi:hypothetical protein